MSEPEINNDQITINKNESIENIEKTDYYSVIVCSLTSLLFGINLTSYATLTEIFKEGAMNKEAKMGFVMSDTLWSVSQSILNIGAIFGNIFIGFVIINNKIILVLNDFFFIIGYILLLIGNNAFNIIIARFVIGFGIGVVSSITPIYLSKLANKNNKGLISTCHQLFIMIGVLCGNIISYFFSSASLWKFSIYIQIGIVLIHFICGLFAKKVLTSESGEVVDIRTLFTTKAARKSIIIAFALHIGQQLSCINGIIFESDNILKDTNNPKLCSMTIGIAAILGVFVTMAVIDKFGRKILLLLSTTMISIFLFVIGNNKYKVISLFGFIISFSVGMGPIPWFITNEIFLSNYVSTINMVSVPVNWFTSFLITQSIKFLLDTCGERIFWVFGGIMVLLTLFILFFFTETRGKNPEFQ